jgi:hypothetical protein
MAECEREHSNCATYAKKCRDQHCDQGSSALARGGATTRTWEGGGHRARKVAQPYYANERGAGPIAIPPTQAPLGSPIDRAPSEETWLLA